MGQAQGVNAAVGGQLQPQPPVQVDPQLPGQANPPPGQADAQGVNAGVVVQRAPQLPVQVNPPPGQADAQGVNAGVVVQVNPQPQVQVNPPPGQADAQGVNAGVVAQRAPQGVNAGVVGLDDSSFWIVLEMPHSHKVELLTYRAVAESIGFIGTQADIVIPRGDYFFYKSEERQEPREILVVPDAICLRRGNLVYIRPRKVQTEGQILQSVRIQSVVEHCKNQAIQRDPLEFLLEKAYDDITNEVYLPTATLADSWTRDVWYKMCCGRSALRRNSLINQREKLEKISFSTSSLLSVVEEFGGAPVRAKVREMKRRIDGDLRRVEIKMKYLDELIARSNKIIVLIGFISAALAWGLAAVLVHAGKKDKYRIPLTAALTAGSGTAMFLVILLAVYALLCFLSLSVLFHP